MKQAYYISRILIFITILFGIISIIPNRLKENSRIIITLFIGITLATHIFFKKNHLFLNILLILIVLISSISFTNFFVDLISKPIIPAIDCEGHTPMNMNWLKGFFLGPIFTLIICYFYMKNINEKTITDRLLLFICILVLVISFLRLDFILFLNKHEYMISKPTIILPEDC